MGRDPPVLGVVVLLGEVFLVVGEESVELQALLEVLDCFQTADVFHEVEIPVRVYAGLNESVPVDALQLDVGIVLLKAEVQRFSEVDVRSLDRVHVLTRHLELVEVEVLWENLHFNY